MDFKILTQTVGEKNFLSPDGPNRIILAGLFKAAQGAIAAGKVLSKNADDELIAAAKETETAAGDGSDTTFTFTFAGKPLAPGTIRVTTADATPKTLKDDGRGGLYGDDGAAHYGSVNYARGVVDVTFAAAPANTVAITCTGYGRLAGVNLQAINTASLTAGQVVARGGVLKNGLDVGGSVPDEAVVEGLREIGVWAF